MSGGHRYYRALSPADRARTMDAYDDLLDAACAARREGWLPVEHDPIYAASRELKVWLWPALAARIAGDAMRVAAAP